MSPTLEPGDFLVAVRSSRIRRGSLVVVEHPERPGYEMVKRVSELADERVWVVGDNPDGSTDSRQFGAVGEHAIRGMVRLRYWPPSRWTVFG